MVQDLDLHLRRAFPRRSAAGQGPFPEISGVRRPDKIHHPDAGLDQVADEPGRTGAGEIFAFTLDPPLYRPAGRADPAVFERISTTGKFNSIYSNLYGGEKGFYDACRRYGVRHFVYSIDCFLDNSVYSTRYLVDRTNFDTRTAAFLFQFKPQDLRYFRLVWQNEYFRVYSVGTGGASSGEGLPYDACYDPAVFRSSGISYPGFLLKWDQACSLKSIGDLYFSRNRGSEAEQYYARSLEMFPQFPDVLANMGRIYLGKKRIGPAETAFARSLSIAYSPEAAYGLTVIAFFHKQFEQRERALVTILNRPPLYLPAVVDLVDIYMKKNDFEGAIRLCQKAITAYPDRPDLRETLIRVCGQANRPDLARQAYADLEKIRTKTTGAPP